MLLSLSIFVFFAAIFLFFSQEFIGLFKRTSEIKTVRLVLPLLLASWLVYVLDDQLLAVAIGYTNQLRSILFALQSLLPFGQIAGFLVHVLFLTVIAVVPVYLLDYLFRKKSYRAYPYAYATSAMLWVINTLLLFWIYPL